MSSLSRFVTSGITRVDGESLIEGPDGVYVADVSNAAVLASGATTARSMAEIESDVANVLNFGADPTGTNDSTTAVTESAATGRQPYVPDYAKLKMSAISPINFVHTIPQIPYALAPGQEGGYNSKFANYGARNLTFKTATPLSGTTPSGIGQAVYNTSLYTNQPVTSLGFYTGIEVQEGSGNVWGENTNILVDSNAGNVGIIGYEMDINVTNQDYPINGSQVCYAFFVNGGFSSGFSGTAAYAIAGVSPSAKSWHVGFFAGSGTATDSTLLDNSSSTVSLDIAGSHTIGLDFVNASFVAGVAIRLAANQSMVVDGTTSLRYLKYNETNFSYNYDGYSIVQFNDNGFLQSAATGLNNGNLGLFAGTLQSGNVCALGANAEAGYTNYLLKLSINNIVLCDVDNLGNLKSNTVSSNGFTVATLPAGSVGMRAYVTDATSPTFLGTLTGGGTVTCPVFYNGSAWVAG
jgi:hypothetical protein